MARMSIRDIARQAGVSPATVSRYLNNKPGQMTEQTRARIAEVIERTGYRPRAGARNLRLENSRLIGVILADSSNPYSAAMLEELSGLAAARGYSLMTSLSGSDPARERDALLRLIDAGVEALIVNTCGGCEDELRSAADLVPTVLLDRSAPGCELDLVTSNNAELMVELVDVLAGRGCARCLLLTESGRESPIRHERARAFTAELDRRGMDGRVVVLPVDERDTARLLAGLVAVPETAPCGLIAVNGLVLLRMVDAFEKLGSDALDRVHLATFDDYPWNRVLYGGVTAAAQDTSAIADAVLTRAVERVEARGKGRAPLSPERIEIAGHVVVRGA